VCFVCFVVIFSSDVSMTLRENLTTKHTKQTKENKCFSACHRVEEFEICWIAFSVSFDRCS
jgi:hypothetical protein